MSRTDLPLTIPTGVHRSGHIQGIAVDLEKGFLYCSYTQMLLKLDLQGNLIGSCTGLLGHLGCIAFNKEDGKVYGSLEYKNDSIGKGILKFAGKEDTVLETSFFIAVFDVDKIDRPDIDACTSGVMKAAFLKEVTDDFNSPGEGGKDHRYGCSGIDGTSFGPRFGQTDGKYYLTVAYGIYTDNERTDNDRQVILQYDIADWDDLLLPLSQENFHRSGPAAPDGKYFLFTGNTHWGTQNLEYDPEEGRWIFCVYRGMKPQYPNYPTYTVFARTPVVKNAAGEEEIFLSDDGILHEPTGIRGWKFPLGTTGICALGDGLFYVSDPEATRDGLQSSTVRLCKRVDGEAFLEFVTE